MRLQPYCYVIYSASNNRNSTAIPRFNSNFKYKYLSIRIILSTYL